MEIEKLENICRNETYFESLHHSILDSCMNEEEEVTERLIIEAIQKNFKIDPFWYQDSKDETILEAAIFTGSVKIIEKIVQFVEIPPEANIFQYRTRSTKLSRTSRESNCYWLTKQQNPFLNALKRHGIGKKRILLASSESAVQQIEADRKTVEIFIALKPILDLVPCEHRKLIMNDGIMTKAIMLNMFHTVKYLCKPENLINLCCCDCEAAGGTYTFIDLAIRYEQPVLENSESEFSITKLLWNQIGGLKGTINKGFSTSQKQWLLSIGVDPETARNWNEVEEEKYTASCLNEATAAIEPIFIRHIPAKKYVVVPEVTQKRAAKKIENAHVAKRPKPNDTHMLTASFQKSSFSGRIQSLDIFYPLRPNSLKKIHFAAVHKDVHNKIQSMYEKQYSCFENYRVKTDSEQNELDQPRDVAEKSNF